MSEMPAMSSALSERSAVLPARNRKHHGLRGDHPARSTNELRLSERGMRQAEEVADLVQRDRFDVIAIGRAAVCGRPRKDRVEVDVRLENASIGRIHRERRRGERSILARLTEIANHVGAVFDKRPRLYEADKRR